jgi:hypothetical protein
MSVKLRRGRKYALSKLPLSSTVGAKESQRDDSFRFWPWMGSHVAIDHLTIDGKVLLVKSSRFHRPNARPLHPRSCGRRLLARHSARPPYHGGSNSGGQWLGQLVDRLDPGR